MGEILVLAGRYLKSALRTRAARVIALVYLAAVLAAIWLPSGATAAGGTLVLFAFVALTLLVYGVAAGVGNGLPDDRRSGRVEWLRTTAPPAWKHRVALVVAGFTLALFAGLCGGVVAAVATTMAAPEFALRSSTDVPLPQQDAMLVRQPQGDDETGAPLTLVLPDAARLGGILELELRPRFESAERLVDFAELDWITNSGAAGTAHASVWRALRVELPPGTDEITFRNRTRYVHVRFRRIRLLAPEEAPVFAMIVGAGLLLGFMAGVAAPVGVVISRFTSGTTATAAAFLILVFGSLEGPILDLVRDIDVEGGARYALGLITVAGWLSPDLPTVALIGEYASGRTIGFSLGSWLPALLAYTVAGTVVAAVPLPATLTERTVDR